MQNKHEEHALPDAIGNADEVPPVGRQGLRRKGRCYKKL
jgi:hypothetical protein